MDTPQFEVIPKREASRHRRPRRERRDWKPVINALVAGESVFMTDEQLTESDVKYLMLSLSRRGKGERLRTERIERGGAEGRLLVVVTEPARVDVPHEVVSPIRIEEQEQRGLSPAQLDRL